MSVIGSQTPSGLDPIYAAPRFETGFDAATLIKSYHPQECGIGAFVSETCATDAQPRARAVLQDYVHLIEKHWQNFRGFIAKQPFSCDPVDPADLVDKFLKTAQGQAVNPKRLEELRVGLTERLRTELFREALRYLF